MEKGTPYHDIGGEETIRQLVEAFYPKVVADPDLAPIFPSEDEIRPVIEKQFLFLSQYFGGPPLYTEQHGHPMMRARHMRFPITPTRAKAWLRCMAEAMDEIGLEGSLREFMLSRLTATANHMVNTADPVE